MSNYPVNGTTFAIILCVCCCYWLYVKDGDAEGLKVSQSVLEPQLSGASVLSCCVMLESQHRPDPFA